jgi:asparagine synthase (glutamine-hydrolysing)
MCGITGLFDAGGAGVDRRVLLQMMTRLAHRGPDGDGWLEDDGTSLKEGALRDGNVRSRRSVPSGPFPSGPRVALGHMRLAITDLSEAGRQPMSRGEGRWWIVFNGAIYNAAEIRRELENLGEEFSTESDTEVLLAAYVRWGREALPRLNGMWAFAVWDARKRELFCARDRYGIKQLCYGEKDGILAFASEPKALRALSALEPDLDLVRFFLARGGATGGGDATCYQNVRAVPEGSFLVAGAAGLRVERWYDLEARVSATARPASFEEAAGRVRELLEDSVRLRLRSDVSVGLLVSGGVDSSAIAGIAARRAGRNGGAFSGRSVSTRYPGQPRIDESFYIRSVLRETGIAGSFIEPTMDGLEADFDDWVESTDMLVSASCYYAQWLLYRELRRRGDRVCLVGQGSDELFGGYEPWEVRIGALWSAGQRGEAAREAWLASRRRFGPVRGLRQTIGLLRGANRTRPCGCRRGSSLREHQGHLFSLDYLPALLLFEDRSSMAWGVESRLPFLDHRLVELARTFPDGWLLRRGWTKAILRSAVADLLPVEVRTRPRKLGLPGPVEAGPRVDSRPAREAWARLAGAGWVEKDEAPPFEGPGGAARWFRVRVADAWRRRCIGPAV